MPQHLAHGLNGNPIREGNGGRKSMSGQVGSQMFFDAAKVSYFFEIGIHLLIGQYG